MESAKGRETVSLVIPAHNEENRIGQVLERYGGRGYEIIVVSNGSTDRTPEIVEGFAEKDGNIMLLEYQERLGKGGAIIEGFTKAKGDLVGFVDADESTKPEEFQSLVKKVIQRRIDGAIASRWVEGSKILKKQPLKRRVASRTFNLIVRLLFGLPYKDTQCGAKVFRGSALRQVIPELRLKGFEFDVELLWRLKEEGFSIEEIPIIWEHDKGSTFNLLNAPSMLLNLLRVRFGRG
jgi:glycosyltransferase involved in cell wall biosynthesis